VDARLSWALLRKCFKRLREREREIVGECWNLGPVLVAFLDRLCLAVIRLSYLDKL